MRGIVIDNRDMAYCIDTYGMFTGESVDEMESEHLKEEYKLTEDEWLTVGFDYDHPAIVKDLAERSISILESHLAHEDDGIVLSVALKESNSPRFYNYTTDWYTALWSIDTDKLDSYVAKHQSSYDVLKKEQNWGDKIEKTYHNGQPNGDYDEDAALIAKLDFYLQCVVSEDDYNSEMWEAESELYSEHMKPDADTQKLIDSKEAKNG